MKPFYVLVHDFNTKRPEQYDIMPYLTRRYKECKEKDYWWTMYDFETKKEPKEPKTFEEFKVFVDRTSKYQYWSRAEYEWIMCPWPYHNLDSEESIAKFKSELVKIDVYDQIEMNLDLITEVFMQNISSQ